MMWRTSTNRSSPRARDQIDNNHSLLISSICERKKNGAWYSTLRPWWSEESQLTQSSPKADWHLIETSPKIDKWDNHSVLISPICEFFIFFKVLHIPPFVPDDVRISAYPKLPESRLTHHRDLTQNWQIGQLFSSHIFNMRNKEKDKKMVLRIPPFVPADLRNLSLLKAHRKQTETSSRSHRKLKNATIIQSSYLQYA